MGRKKKPKLEMAAQGQQQQQYLATPIPRDPRNVNNNVEAPNAFCAPVDPMNSQPPPAIDPSKPISFGSTPIPKDPRKRDVNAASATDILSACVPIPPKELDIPFDGNGNGGSGNNDSAHKSKEVKAEEKKKSGYGMTSHSADLISEDIYVSDGSEDEDEGNVNPDESGPGTNVVELTLTASKMGLMRRGLHSQMFQQAKTWVRPTEDEKEISGGGGEKGRTEGGDADGSDGAKEVSSDENDNDADGGDADTEKEDEELTKNMDPAQRAAFLHMEKQRKLEEVARLKRKMESAENAGRDPCLFSKRTAFDIRMDQIEEKPWDRTFGGTADITDYFNYGMGEEDWLEYSERQLAVRQELTDAGRQRRNPDPTIVPVVPRTPSTQNPRVAVVVKKKDGKKEEDNAVSVGPSKPTKPDGVKSEGDNDSDGDVKMKEEVDVDDSSKDTSKGNASSSIDNLGGAWAAPPGSKLAQLIEEQEKNKNKPPPPPPAGVVPPGPPSIGSFRGHQQQQQGQSYNNNNNNNNNNYYQQHQGGGGGPPPPPPPGPPSKSYHQNNQYGGGGGGRYQSSSHGGQYHGQQRHQGHQYGGGRGFHPGRGGRGDYGGGGRFGGRGGYHGRGGGRGYHGGNDWRRR